MKTSLKFTLLAAAIALGVAASTPSFAATYTPPPLNASDFAVTETVGVPGHYQVFNNSDSWYVYQLEVTHSPDAFGPLATRSGWTQGTCTGLCLNGQSTFIYVNTTFFSGTVTTDLTNDIAPHTASAYNDFLFNAIFAASSYRLDVTDGVTTAFVFGETTDAVSTTPLPAALPLMGSVLGAGFMVRRWRKRRAV